MKQPNPAFAKIPILDTGKFEQWKFRIQQYLQNEHYALWEVIEFGDSYKAPQEEAASESLAKKKGRAVVITTEDMQKRRNDVKARTSLLLALPDEHQLRFSKYETAQELFWKKTGKKITIQGTDVAGFDKSKVECFNCHKMGHFAREYRAPKSQDRENHALVADDEAPIEFALMAKSSPSFENEVKKEKEGLDSKLTGFQYASNDLDTLLGSQRTVKNKEGLPEFADDTITDYSRPSSSIESNTSDLQNNNSSVSKHGESSSCIMSKPMIKFVKAADSPTVIKTNKVETARKSSVKYAEMCDNGGEFRNKEMNEFFSQKGIKREFSNARTPQQNGVAERRNRTLIEVARTMLADAKLPVTFWTEAVNIACYVQNRVLVNKSQNKTPYELFNGFLRPFGCHVMILNTLDHLGKFDTKGDEVVIAGTSSTNISGTKDAASQGVKKDVSPLRYIALPNWFHEAHMESSNNDVQDACNVDALESSRISNPTATLKNNSLETSSGLRLISKEVFSQEETPSLDNILTLSNRIHKDHPKSQIIGHVDTPVQTRHKSKEMEEHSFIATIHQKTTPDLLQFCLFLCFLSQKEPKKIFDALKDPFWVLKNKKDERGIVIRNKARLAAQGHTQEEGIDYKEVFALVARIEAIRLFLAYASFMRFTVYQMDVKSAFLYGTINEEVYVMQPLRFQDPEFPDRVYKLCKEFKAIMYEKFQMSAMGELNIFLGLQVLQQKDGIFLSQDKYVGDILKKFRYLDVRSANTPMDKENPWREDGPGKDVELHLYRSMIGSLMYLTASRPDIMFAVCACTRHQVTPKECHLYVVKRIFRYLNGHPKLGLGYPKENPFDLVVYSNSNYGGATQDRKSTTGGCQFLGRRLISCQCKKQTIVATSTTEAEYVAAVSGCGQILWIQNQMLDYRHHFIRDCYEKKLINVDHIHTDDNVADLLIKPFDVGRFQYVVDWGIHRILMISLRLIPQFWSTARIKTTNEGTKILATVDGTTIPYHDLLASLHLTATTESIPTETPTEIPTLRKYSRRATQIAQSKALPTAADEPASLLRDDSQGEAFPTVSSLDAG
nr:hypothetical protein [Tanacetum cinerariifolium]